MTENSQKLIIIESPNKIKTIQKYVGNGYEIIATVGHIRDIPASNAKAFDKETYEPHWQIISTPRSQSKKIRSKKSIVTEIKVKAKKASKIYLASDPDREGEAISWHVYDVLDKESKEKCVRITFNEITKNAILQAIQNERQIQMEWVYSQFARRIIDRIVGYDLSWFVHKKYSGISAGRVQSVVLKFLYERELEIKKFISTKWWTLDVCLSNNDQIILKEISPKINNKVHVLSDDKKQTSGIDFCSFQDAEIVKNDLAPEFQVVKIDPAKQIKSNSKDPYKTSTLQQDAVNKLGFNLGKATTILQELYEGVSVDGDPIAFITYPRTDSIRMADTFISAANEFIVKEFGQEYVGKTKRIQKDETNVQNAHECIRPVDITIVPDSLKNKISKEHYLMYKMIWQRTLASLMAPCISESTTIWLENNQNKFSVSNKRIIFDGFHRAFDKEIDKGAVTNYSIGQKFTSKEVDISEHETRPPERYTQASLIKMLDESGVGRPSTYKTMADIGLSRGYCKLEKGMYYVTEIGFTVIEGLIKDFPNVIDRKFTSDMEERLDKIADKKEKWNAWIIDFVPRLQQKIQQLSDTIEKQQPIVEGKLCPKCGSQLVYRFSKKTKKQFIGCSNYPKCDYIEGTNKTEVIDEKCPLCGNKLVIRHNRRNEKFIGCSNFPKCRYLRSLKEDKKNNN